MSQITVVENPLNKTENLVFGLNDKGGLKIYNSTLFDSQDDETPVRAAEEGPGFQTSSLTSVVFRNMVCVFGIAAVADGTGSRTIALLSPVFTRFHNHRTKFDCISSVTSSDGEQCWIYYRSLDGAIQQLSLPDMGLTQIIGPCDVAERTSLVAFTDSAKIPKVIYQTTDCRIHVSHGIQATNLVIPNSNHAMLNTPMSVTNSMFGGVEMVYLYIIGKEGYLERLRRRNNLLEWSPPKPFTKREKFTKHQFAVIHDGMMEENKIYHLNDKLVFMQETDRYNTM